MRDVLDMFVRELALHGWTVMASKDGRAWLFRGTADVPVPSEVLEAESNGTLYEWYMAKAGRE